MRTSAPAAMPRTARERRPIPVARRIAGCSTDRSDVADARRIARRAQRRHRRRADRAGDAAIRLGVDGRSGCCGPDLHSQSLGQSPRRRCRAGEVGKAQARIGRAQRLSGGQIQASDVNQIDDQKCHDHGDETRREHAHIVTDAQPCSQSGPAALALICAPVGAFPVFRACGTARIDCRSLPIGINRLVR